jgi:hypothetical protein
MNRIVKIVLGVVLVLAIAAGSFYGGMLYGQNQAEAQPQAQAGLAVPEGMVVRGSGDPGQVPPGGAPGGNRRQGGMLVGEITVIGDGVLTLEDESGEEVQVYVTDTTLIQKQADVTIADLEEGETVFVSGSRGDDGSVTARMVQVTSGEGFGMPGGLPPGRQQGSDSGSANP